MTTAQSRFYNLLISSPGGVIESDVSTILYEEDEVSCLKDFLKTCASYFAYTTEIDDERERWFHIAPLLQKPELKSLIIQITPELHTRLKLITARKGITIREFATRALEREMGER